MQELFHGTSDRLLAKIATGGLKKPNLTDDHDIAMYYAEEACEEFKGVPVVLTVDVDESTLRVDQPAFDEPLTFYRDNYASSDEEWSEMLTAGEIPSPKNKQDWETSLLVTNSVKCISDIAPDNIRLDGYPIKDAVKTTVAAIKQVLAEGEPNTMIRDEWGEGNLDKEPILIPERQRGVDVRHPQFLAGDGISAEPSDKDAIESF